MYQRKLIEIEKNLQDKGKDIELEKDLVCTVEKLRNIQNAKFQGQKIRAKANWLKDGDRGFKYFFTIIINKEERENIDGIYTSKGITKDNNEIVEAFHQFYSHLFMSESSSMKIDDMNKYMSLIPRKVTEDQIKKLNMLISVQEISTTIFSMANGKSLGANGFPAEFYIEH